MIQVIIEKPDDRNDALKKPRNLKVANYEGVYMREDRTQVEQIEFARLNKEKNEKNDELKELDLLDKPFCYIIHRWTGVV